jgi:ATP-binding cassette, subfamily B, bacterial
MMAASEPPTIGHLEDPAYLSGLYRPSAGRILVDGTDLAQFAPEDWRARITAAFQDPVHKPRSIPVTGPGPTARRAAVRPVWRAYREAC